MGRTEPIEVPDTSTGSAPNTRRGDPGWDRAAWHCRSAVFIMFFVLAAMAAWSYLASGREGDFQHFYDAARAVRFGENIYFYEEIDAGEDGLNWYIYMPMFALLLSPLAWLPFSIAGAVWAFVNAGLLMLSGYLIAREASRCFDADRPLTLWGGLLIGCLFMADKLRGEINLGQSDGLIMLSMVLGLVWMSRRPLLAGAALAVAVNIKFQGLIFLPYLLVMRRWKTAAAQLVTSVAIALAGSLVWGWKTNGEYLSICLGWFSSLFGLTEASESADLNPLEWHRSVSVPSVIERARLAYDLPEWLPVAGALGGALLAFALGWWLYISHGASLFEGRGRRADDELGGANRPLVLLEWLGLIVAALAFGPQSTVRHFVITLIGTVTAGVLLAHPVKSPRGRVLLIASVAFMLSLILPPGKMVDAVETWRAVGGAGWMLLIFYFVLLWAGLGRFRDARCRGACTDRVAMMSRVDGAR